jgi:hypothetical protein
MMAALVSLRGGMYTAFLCRKIASGKPKKATTGSTRQFEAESKLHVRGIF